MIKKHFKDDEVESQPPILCRQVATKITYDETEGRIIDSSIIINEKYRHEAYVRHCLKEYLVKYGSYKNSLKKIYFGKILFKTKLPMEIILEILKYI